MIRFFSRDRDGKTSLQRKRSKLQERENVATDSFRRALSELDRAIAVMAEQNDRS
jgi:hypothetical protein